MNKSTGITINKDYNIGDNGFKVVQVNVSNPADNLYAVCTPVQNNK